MDVIQRNFLRLLRSGAFGGQEDIEPMSAWKWDRLYSISLMHGVAAIVADGIAAHRDKFFMQIPEGQMERWHETTAGIENANRHINAQLTELFATMNAKRLRPILLKGQGTAALYDNPLHRTGGDIDIFFPYTPQAEKADEWAESNGTDVAGGENDPLEYQWNGIKVEHHRRIQRLTNRLLNRKLQNITDKEIRCCDSSYAIIDGNKIEVLPPTINLLLIIIRITRYILNEGVSLKQVIDLGIFLRKAGDKVDYVKLQKWLRQLKLQNMARLIASLLKRLFYFEEEEMQFIEGKANESANDVIGDTFQIVGSHTTDWYFTQGKNIFVRTSDSSAMLWQIRHSAKYFRYYPSETVTNFFSTFAHSLSRIEE